MWLKITYIFFLMPLFCKSQIQARNTLSNIRINVSTSEKIVNQSVKMLPLSVEITNGSSNKFFILNFYDFSTDSLSVFQLLIKKEGEIKLSPDGLLKKKRIPKLSDYKKLNPGETLSFKYDLDLSILAGSYKELGQKNKDFGKYNIQVLFRDRFLVKRKAVNYLKSNTVEIEYNL